MAYYIIYNHPVFISWQRYKALMIEIGLDKGSGFPIASAIAGTKKSKEKSNLILKNLNQKYLDDPKDFYNKWVKFDLPKDEAPMDVWDLLFDYCHLYGYSYLSELRDIDDRLIADYEGDAYRYPMGRVFALNHFVEPANWFWKFTHKMKGRSVQVIIDTHIVIRLVGDLSQFKVFTKSYIIECGPNFKIYPT